MNTTTAPNLNDTTDVAGWVVAKVALSVAAEGIPGHDLDTVMAHMTTDDVLNTIRADYDARCDRGDNRGSAASTVGLRALVAYYDAFNL
ncbi:hypothetical protein ACFVJK_46835 [Streptomyces sp. NPDC127172]|uniref:hypothetical protein n=1 Tax=Streptomyces sp. NPDC127172 TaxID=3345382 RepID=UPI0036410258